MWHDVMVFLKRCTDSILHDFRDSRLKVRRLLSINTEYVLMVLLSFSSTTDNETFSIPIVKNEKRNKHRVQDK